MELTFHKRCIKFPFKTVNSTSRSDACGLVWLYWHQRLCLRHVWRRTVQLVWYFPRRMKLIT